MQYATEKIERARNDVMQAEQRIARQRRRVEKMLVERHPADEAQAQLLIMEQSLISMTRFLKNLERELEIGDLSLQSKPSPRRMGATTRPPEAAPDQPPPPKYG